MSAQPPYIRQPWPKSRQSQRLLLEGRLTIHGPEGKVRGWLHDVSEDGVGGVVSAQLKMDTEVDVEFELKPEEPPVRVRAIVRFANGFRYGFQFVTISPEQKDAIRQFCATVPQQPKKP